MSFMEELSKVYESSDNTDEAMKALDDFLKPCLLEAAKSRKTSCLFDYKTFPDVVKNCDGVLHKWVKKNGLEMTYDRYVGLGYISGWAKKQETNRVDDPDKAIRGYTWFFSR